MMLTPTPRKNVKHVFLVKCRKSLSQNRANTGQPDHMRLYTVMYVAQFKWNQKAAENTCSHSQMTFHGTPLLTSLNPRVKCFRNSWNLMLCQAKLPLEFWAEACSTAVYHHNQSPRAALKDETPFQRLFGRRPYISNLRVFGCVSYVHVPDSQRRKLDGKAHRTIFVGYPPGVKGYKLYNLEKTKFTVSRDVEFFEENFDHFDKKAISDDDGQADVRFIFPDMNQENKGVPVPLLPEAPQVQGSVEPVVQKSVKPPVQENVC